MSLGINTATPEGMVLAADSRQSYRNQKKMTRIGSDSASKVFKLGDSMGLIVTGLAFLPSDGGPQNISRFVEEFRQEIDGKGLKIEEVAEKLKRFFEEKYPYREQLESIPSQIRADLGRRGFEVVEIKKAADHVKFKFKDHSGNEKQGVAGVDQLQFILAGYNEDNIHQVALIYIPGEAKVKRDSGKLGHEYGAAWIGQTDVVTRIVLGFDSRITNLPFIRKMVEDVGQEEVSKQLRNLEYVIQWGTMTLQDAIDFSVLAIETTTAIQRFSDGVKGDPGDMPGVGGPIDVAVITSEKGFVWVSKKNLKVDGKEIDLEKVEDLSK